MFTKKTRVISMLVSVCMLISLMAVFCFPAAAADDLSAYPSVSTITEAVTAGDYVITNEDDWEYLETNIANFRNANVTIHLGADIDLSEADFAGFVAPGFAFDGHGYTVSNWGTKLNPASAKGMFIADYSPLCPPSITNLNLYNCHVSGATGVAVLCAVSHANGGTQGLPANVNISNITAENCSATNDGENTAIILSRYASVGVDATVNISNIYLSGCEISATGNHAGLLVGKPRSGNAGEKTHYEISNVYLYNNTVNATMLGHSLVVGTAENGGAGNAATSLAFSNIAAIDNTINTNQTNASLMGNIESVTPLALNGVALNNTTVNATAEQSVNLYGMLNGQKATVNGLYCDTELAAVAQSNATPVLAGSVIDEAAAHALNAAATEDSLYYWTIYYGYLINTEDGVASSMRKVELKLALTGRVVETIYAEAGSEITLTYDEDPTATFSTANEAATIEGNILTVPTDGTDVVVDITLGEGGETIVARNDLQESIDAYEGKNLDYYVLGLAEKIAEAEAAIADPNAEVSALYVLKDELDAWEYANVAPYLPSVSESETYPGVAGYMINDEEDLLVAKANEGNYTADTTLYLGAGLDLTGVDFAGFSSAAKFKFDGRGHTISNWTKAASGAAIAFFNKSNVTSIQNVTFDNINLSGAATGSAIVYGSHAGDSVVAGMLTIKNVHVKNSVLASASEQAAIFVTGIQNSRTGGYLIDGCSIVDSKIDGSARTGSGNNYAGFIGRFHSGNASNSITVQNCYADNFDIINGGNEAAIFINAVAGNSGKTVYVQNCVAVNCDLAAVGDIALLGARIGGAAVYLRDIALINCTAESENLPAATGSVWRNTNGPGEYLAYGNQDWFGTGNLNNIYAVADVWSGDWFYNINAGSTGNFPTACDPVTAEALASGEVAYTMNTKAAATAGYSYWAMDGGKIVPAASKNDATVKVEIKIPNGTVIDTLYANGTVTLNVEDAVSYAMAEGATGTIEGNVLTLAGDGENTAVIVTLGGDALKGLYLADIATLVAYFEGFTAGELTDELADLVAEAKAMTLETDVAALEEAAIALNGYYNGAYAPTAREVDAYPESLAYSIWTKADLEYLSANTAKFNREGVVVYFAADIDMTGTTTFTTMANAKFAIDGLNHKIHDWDWSGFAIFKDNYQGGFVKNLTFENVRMVGGYSRAILFSEYTGSSVTIENVNMINVTLDTNCSASHNQMGLYISRTNADVAGATITIKNCVVKNSSLENGCGSTINNCGILAGCIKNKYNFVVENVDIIDCENNTETAAGGLAIGSIESSGTSTITDLGVFGGAMTTASTAPYAGVMIGLTNDKPVITMTDCVAMGVETLAQKTWMNRDQGTSCESHTATLTNCVSDFGSAVRAVNNADGTEVVEKSLPDLEGVTVTTDLYEAAYIVDRYVSDAEGAYPSTAKGEGYAETYKIDLYDLSSGEEVYVDTFYTLASGKLPSAAADVLADDLYNWKYEDADVDANTVFTADSKVTSASQHNFDGLTESVTGTTHRVYCSDDDCSASIVVDCSADSYTQGYEGNSYIHTAVCVCENVLDSGNCEFEHTHVEGTNTHKGVCETCEREIAAVSCVFKSEGTIKEGDEATTSQPGKMTYECTAGCGNEKVEILAQIAHATVQVQTGATAILGEDFVAELVLSGNAAPGVSGLVAIVTYDANAMTIGDIATDVVLHRFTGTVVNEVVEGVGTLKIAVASDEPVTAEMAFATITFTATSEEANGGAKEIDVEVADAILGATDFDDASAIKLEMTAEGATVNVIGYLWGDVNRSENVSIADVVLILRVANGKLDVAQIDALAADVYTEDDGITTADAILVLRYLLGEYEPNA